MARLREISADVARNPSIGFLQARSASRQTQPVLDPEVRIKNNDRLGPERRANGGNTFSHLSIKRIAATRILRRTAFFSGLARPFDSSRIAWDARRCCC
jgi:hypothetical protein